MATMQQLRIFLPPDGSYWVIIRPDEHYVHAPGTKFLVVDEDPPGWLLCWKDGQQHANPKNLGEMLHRDQVERFTDYLSRVGEDAVH